MARCSSGMARQRTAGDSVPRTVSVAYYYSSMGSVWHLFLLICAVTTLSTGAAGAGSDDDEALDGMDDSAPPFDFVGLIVFVVAVAGLVYAALKLAGRGDMFGESGYLAEQERLAREEAARAAEEEKAKETEYQLK